MSWSFERKWWYSVPTLTSARLQTWWMTVPDSPSSMNVSRAACRTARRRAPVASRLRPAGITPPDSVPESGRLDLELSRFGDRDLAPPHAHAGAVIGERRQLADHHVG